MNRRSRLNAISHVSAFLIGVLLFWSIGKDWLNLGSASVLSAGLIGIAAAVLMFGLRNIYHDSDYKEN